MTKLTKRMNLAVAALMLLTCLLVFIPAPITGYWRTPYSDCLCHSSNLMAFKSGEIREWATAHGIANKHVGRFTRSGFYTYNCIYDDGLAAPESIVIRTGWFRMQMIDDKGIIWYGTRELRPWHISRVVK